MVSRYDDELNIWDDAIDQDVENRVHRAIMNAIKPHKITPKKGTTIMENVIKEDICRQIESFIEDWAGDMYVIPGELYSLYKNYCKENNEDCLIPTSQAFGRRLSRFTDNGTIKRVVQNEVPYYIKPAFLKVAGVEAQEKLSGTKRKVREEDDSIRGESDQPRKKKRDSNLLTWSSIKEMEEFTLKISELESQVSSLMEICKRQKELITRLSVAAGGTQ
jgi:hypothetical protein